MQLTQFDSDHLYDAALTFFKGLNMPVKELGKQTYDAQQLLDDKFLPNNEAHQLLNDIYLIGLIDDDAFQGIDKGTIEEIENYKEYDGILVLAVKLKDRRKNLRPTRTHLSQLTRAFNRKFPTTPAVIIYHYDQYLAFANVERLAYKQEWKQAEGEKSGKVSLLRDVKISDPHTGHLKILQGIEIKRTGKKGVNNLADLYKHWQTVFNVSVLSKAFYEELFHWYLWAVKNVTFPNKPTLESVVKQYGKIDNNKLEELVQEHKAKNIIRLLTRLLFVWFIKEKGLIPEELFKLEDLQKDILKNISPYKQVGLLKEANDESIFYKAILQNLFFAALNCPIDASNITGDTRKRGFRDNNFYGQNRGVDYLMRYEKYFQSPGNFLSLLNTKVPFLNGGLFECLDEKENNLYIDGFSDNMKKGEQLIVPDFLFFGHADTVNLSKEYGIKKRGTEKAAVKGLIGILKSYKFTIAENTPIEEDIALDPELLGKVFENLLASYNPETKTTARKQTGSFYTPREIVDYMVDESLIAYLKTKILQENEGYTELGTTQGDLFGNKAKAGQLSFESKIDESKWKGKDGLLDTQLHQLFSYDAINPFVEDEETTLEVIRCLDSCKILDPACGSGAFPMGVLQKMVHVLGKLDHGNKYWRNKQITKVRHRMEDDNLSKADLKEIREQLIDIEKAFDENDSDYSRKLFLIENCIYGVDIQPIATQISKLRFFISLIVDQNVAKDKPKDNFGIRPLPNLETKFVTANTLIGIEKPDSQLSLFETSEVKKLESELKRVRHKIFSAKSKETKTKYRLEDERLREEIADKLLQLGWATNTATQLAEWNPFDQNYIAPFFDTEWMFGISTGFDLVIGNPPYFVYEGTNSSELPTIKKIKLYDDAKGGKLNAYKLFLIKSSDLVKNGGHICEIFQNSFLGDNSAKNVRRFFLDKHKIISIDSFPERDNASKRVFPGVKMSVCILLSQKNILDEYEFVINTWESKNMQEGYSTTFNTSQVKSFDDESRVLPNLKENEKETFYAFFDSKQFLKLGDITRCYRGELNMTTERRYFTKIPNNYMALKGAQIQKYYLTNEMSQGALEYVEKTNYLDEKKGAKSKHFKQSRIVTQRITGVNEKYRLKAAIAKSGNFCADSCNYILKPDNYSLVYLLALINSSLHNWIFKKTSTNSNVNSYEVENLMIPHHDRINTIPFNHIIPIISYCYSSQNKSQANIFQKIIDSMVFENYFNEHMHNQNINIIEFTEKDLREVLRNKDFKDLSDAQKEKVVDELYQRWSNPNSEIQKRMGLFKERSPDILKPILESR